jgi:endonuclease/exonuclease/phosphatase family metal-dependent hydrolase
MFANVYSDTQHMAVRILHEDLVALPRLHLMCGDFNIRHASWDPNGPEVCVHVDRLMAVCDALRLTLSSPVEEGPTHFPFNEALTPTVIDLMFVPAEGSLTTEHEIHPDLRGTSDHAPLMVTLPGLDSEVPVTHRFLTCYHDLPPWETPLTALHDA